MGRKKKDLTGLRFGRLVVLYEEGRSKSGDIMWHCRCDCGNEVTVTSSNLLLHKSSSCGCYRTERAVEASTTHGGTHTRLYRIWTSIMVRAGEWKCSNKPLAEWYKNRGITVCEEWKVFENFYKWAMSNGYDDGLEIDRVDNELGYCPENCHWVSRKDNVRNRRCTLRLSDGTTLSSFCELVGIEVCRGRVESRTYHRIRDMWSSRHKAHPELVEAANQTILEMRQCLELLRLLDDVKAFKAQYLIY